jgi:hypothetical protein
MDAKRLEELLGDIWDYVFLVFDREPELTGEDAGRIATAAEDAARHATLSLAICLGSTTLEAIVSR